MSRLRQAARRLTSPAFAAPTSVALLGFLASATSLANGFVYDDRPIIQRNARVHTLAHWWEAFGQAYWPPSWGDTNYRPLTVLSFALQWALGQGSPFVFHATSVALYLATCVAVLRLARLVLPTSAAWMVAALFAVHPVHVEAVGNVVGQSEIVVALCSTLAVVSYVRGRVSAAPPGAGTGAALPLGSVAAITVAYLIACFSKETGFVLPGLLLAAECTVVAAALEPARRTVRARARELRRLAAPCALIAVGYLALRHQVLGGFGDDPNVVISLLSHRARLLTMLGVVPEWARLLLWPAHLSADYAPPQIPLILGLAPAVIPGVTILLGAVLLGVAGWRTRRRVATFGLLWVAVAIFPVSNVVLRSGVILAERTLFLPSIGALLAVGAALAWVGARIAALPRRSGLTVAAPLTLGLAAMIATGAARSAARQRVWHDSDVFLDQIVRDAPLNYRAHYLHGMWLFDKKRRDEAEAHVRLAIRMFPYDAGPHVDLADRYREAGFCAPAYSLYRRALKLEALHDRARLGLVACLLNDGRFADAVAEARIGASAGGLQVREFRRLLAIGDSALAAQRSRRLPDAAFRVRQSGKGSDP